MSISTTEIEVSVKEDEKNLYFSYDFQGYPWCLIYNKNKDKCLLLKNSKPAPIKKLTQDEVDAYMEVLSLAISEHHEKGDAETH